MRPLGTGLAILALATATHLDWHVARPATHHLSLGWSWHWALAIPVFAVTALFVARSGPARPGLASITVVGAGAVLGAIVEPAWEYWLGDASFDWAFGAARTRAAATFLAVGAVSYYVAFRLVRSRRVARSRPFPG